MMWQNMGYATYASYIIHNNNKIFRVNKFFPQPSHRPTAQYHPLAPIVCSHVHHRRLLIIGVYGVWLVIVVVVANKILIKVIVNEFIM